MKKHDTTKYLFLILISLFVSCKPREKDNKGYDPKIENKRWVLRELNNKLIQTPAGEKEISLFFEPTINEFTADGKCNNLHGMYTSQGELIKIVNMSSTKMACPQLELESEFIKALNETNKYKIRSKKVNGVANDYLYLFNENILIASFEKVNQ
jgi:heat shock protein HslJ